MKLSATYNVSETITRRILRTVTIEDKIDDCTVDEVLRDFVRPILIAIGYSEENIKGHVDI